jgi:SSS family solute:Na+ symporter
MHMHVLDLFVLVLYFLGMAGIGVFCARRNRNTEQYFVGGRNYAGWAIGISLIGYSISSVTFVAFPADAYKTAWLRFVPNLMLPVGIFLSAYFFLPFFRRQNVTSAYEFLERRFGPSVRFYAAFAFILGQLVRISVILYLVALVVEKMTGMNPVVCILVAGVVTSVYTIFGGIDAVIWTDVIQAIILLLGGLLCLGLIAYKLPGGFGEIFSVAHADGKFGLSELVNGRLVPAGWRLSFNEKTVSMLLMFGLVNWLTEYSSNQNTVQRYVASRSTAEARKAIYICGFSSLPIWGLFMFLGTALYVFFKHFPVPEAAAMLNGTRKAEEILPFFIVNYMPPGLSGLIVAGLLAAAMSSLSACINAVATVSTVDFYQRLFVRNHCDAHYLRAARVFAALVSLLMIVGAIILLSAQTMTLQNTMLIISSLLSGGILGIYIMGILTRRGDIVAVWAGIIFTLLFTVWTLLSEQGLLPARLAAGFDLYYTGMLGNALMVLVIIIVALLRPRLQKPLAAPNPIQHEQYNHPTGATIDV